MTLGRKVTFDPASGSASFGPSTIESLQFNMFKSVACPSLAQCTAVDDAGRQVTFDPTS